MPTPPKLAVLKKRKKPFGKFRPGAQFGTGGKESDSWRRDREVIDRVHEGWGIGERNEEGEGVLDLGWRFATLSSKRTITSL